MDKKEDLNNIHLTLTQNEANTIIEGLACLPFKEVYKLIEKIHLQANSLKLKENTEK